MWYRQHSQQRELRQRSLKVISIYSNLWFVHRGRELSPWTGEKRRSPWVVFFSELMPTWSGTEHWSSFLSILPNFSSCPQRQLPQFRAQKLCERYTGLHRLFWSMGCFGMRNLPSMALRSWRIKPDLMAKPRWATSCASALVGWHTPDGFYLMGLVTTEFPGVSQWPEVRQWFGVGQGEELYFSLVNLELHSWLNF